MINLSTKSKVAGTFHFGMAEQLSEVEEKVKSEALQIINLFQNLPHLIVFDLDYTLWPFYCGDEDDTPELYPHVRGILYALKDRGIKVAIASRSPASNVAMAFLRKLGVDSMFVAQEIFYSWTYKTDHFQRINTTTGISFDSMLFFDDEYSNIEAVSKMGVTCNWVDRGVNLVAFRGGLATFSKKSPSMIGPS